MPRGSNLSTGGLLLMHGEYGDRPDLVVILAGMAICPHPVVFPIRLSHRRPSSWMAPLLLQLNR
jgi:hypothetical protein